jgi:hypothetical protein
MDAPAHVEKSVLKRLHRHCRIWRTVDRSVLLKVQSVPENAMFRENVRRTSRRHKVRVDGFPAIDDSS